MRSIWGANSKRRRKDMDGFKPEEVEVVIPDPEDMQLSEDEVQFVFGHAGKMNAIIDAIGRANLEDNETIFATGLSALFAFGFRLGAKYSEGTPLEKE